MAGHAIVIIALYLRFRKDLTPRWLLSVVESEGVASARLILGLFTGIFTLCMQAATNAKGEPRISHELALLNWEAVFGLFALGPIKLVGKAFAARPPEPPAQINAKKVEATAAGDMNMKSEQTNINPSTE